MQNLISFIILFAISLIVCFCVILAPPLLFKNDLINVMPISWNVYVERGMWADVGEQVIFLIEFYVFLL